MADPLTEADLEEINVALAGLSEAKAILARAKSAGLDVGDQERELLETEQRLTGIKGAFFPTGKR